MERRRSTEVKQSLHMFGRLQHWYTIYTFSGFLPGNAIFPGAKFTLRPSLAHFYIGSVNARHSSTGRQPNFAELSRGRHLYSAARPSRWVLAHILVVIIIIRRYYVQLSAISLGAWVAPANFNGFRVVAFFTAATSLNGSQPNFARFSGVRLWAFVTLHDVTAR